MKRLLWLLAVVVLLLGLYVTDFLFDAGAFRTIEPRFQGTCERVSGAPGAEDMALLRPTNMLFISSDDRRARARGEGVQGGIYLYDLGYEGAEPIELTADFPGELHPHGISLWREGAEIRLFVVNHPGAGHSIEIFELDGRDLRHLETVTGDLLTSPNDVAATGPRSFFVTNDHGNTSALGRMLEDYGRLARANVVYFDGESFSVAADGIRYANGIAANPERSEVYVASTTGLEIRKYDWAPGTGNLALRAQIPVQTGVDNIDLDRYGNLWVAAHPQLLRFVAHAGDPAELSPSQVIWLEPYAREGGLTENGERFLESYMGDGSELSGSSVAVAFGSRLVIGSVFEEHFLVCQRE